jgi:hypothetical protein
MVEVCDVLQACGRERALVRHALASKLSRPVEGVCATDFPQEKKKCTLIVFARPSSSLVPAFARQSVC